MLLFLGFGIAVGPLNPILMTVRQERVPDHLLNHVFGTFSATVGIAIPVGLLIGGFLPYTVVPRSTFLACSLGFLGLSLAMLVGKRMRAMDR